MRRVSFALACMACGPSAYVCTEPSQCMNANVAGMCQPDGHCSFPDDDCPSGQRYGEHGGEVAGQCVAPIDTTGTDASTSSSSSTTDPDPTTSTASDSSGTTDTTTDGPVPTMPLLWFTFDEMNQAGIANLGTLGGTASCADLTCPAIVEGIVGNAARFDGIDDCAIFPHAPELGPLTALSISAWVQRSETDADYDCVLCKPVGAEPWNSWRIATYDDAMAGPVLDFRVGLADDSGLSLAGSMATAQWVHTVGVWDGESMVLWIDGVIANEAANDLYEFDEQPVYLGCDDDHELIGITNFLTGAVDEVRFYDRALSDDEIAALHAEGQ